jgi:hypothetical protein
VLYQAEPLPDVVRRGHAAQNLPMLIITSGMHWSGHSENAGGIQTVRARLLSRGYRIYDRSESQPVRQNRSPDPDGDYGAATLREGGIGGCQEVGNRSEEMRPGCSGVAAARCVRHRRPAGNPGVKGLPKDPMQAFRESGYLERITKDRAPKNSSSVTSYA